MANNYADKKTNQILADMETHIRRIYTEAAEDIGKTARAYFDNLPKRIVKEWHAYLDGAYTPQQFAAWLNAQEGRGKRYEKMRDDMARRAVEADKIAAEHINGKTPDIYAINKNYEAYTIERDVAIARGRTAGIAFDIVNEETIKNLVTGQNSVEFRAKWKDMGLRRVDVYPDSDYEWNKKKIQNALTSGILQGKSVDKIASMFMDTMKSNRAAAIRNARTAVTSAQNSGKLATYRESEELGLPVVKEWMCTHDDRTRDSHIELDGVRVAIDADFPNGCAYPADPKGAPQEVYNCRCTMRRVLIGLKNEKAHVTGKSVQSYSAWLKEKRK